jgi:hypothetical protein
LHGLGIGFGGAAVFLPADGWFIPRPPRAAIIASKLGVDLGMPFDSTAPHDFVADIRFVEVEIVEGHGWSFDGQFMLNVVVISQPWCQNVKRK